MLEGLLPLSGYARFFVTLTAVLDPFLAVPIFLALTASRSDIERAHLVRVVTVTVFAVLAVSGLVGEQLLHLVGASLPAFRVGGGLVLLLMALAKFRPFIAGAEFSLADCAAAVHLPIVSLATKLVYGRDFLEGMPQVKPYLQMLGTRPAFAKVAADRKAAQEAAAQAKK